MKVDWLNYWLGIAPALIAVLMLLIALGGCSGPTSPDATYTCYTQPRWYCSPTGVCQQEIDHYDQTKPCPETRIE